jgi:hypothetical protein
MSALVQQAVADAQVKILEHLKTQPTGNATFSQLMDALGFNSPDRYKISECRIDGVAESRILDRALQKLRKADKIDFIRSIGWTLVDRGGVRT